MENASLLEASRRSWKEGGAISEREYKGTERQVGLLGLSWWSSSLLGGRGLLLVVLVEGSRVKVLVLVCGEAVRGATRSLELAVGGESGRHTGDADWRRSSASGVART